MFKYISIVSIALLIASTSTFYYYQQSSSEKYEKLINDLKTQQANLNVYKSINDENLSTIESLQDSYADIQRDYKEVSDQLTLILMNNAELNNKIERHDMNKLALLKPELIENIINKSSIEYNRCISVITGMQKNPNEKNDECPWLYEVKE